MDKTTLTEKERKFIWRYPKAALFITYATVLFLGTLFGFFIYAVYRLITS